MRGWLVLPALAAGCLESPPDAGPSTQCGTISYLSDPFAVATDVWEQHSSTVTDDALLLEAGPDQSSWVITPWAYLLDGGELTVKLRAVELAGTAELRIYLIEPDDDSIGLRLQGGTLSVAIDAGGNQTSPQAVAWDSSRLFLRLRQVSGRLEWATATDGQDWIEEEPVDSPIEGPVAVLLEASGGDATAAVAIDAVNPDAGEGACAASTMVDDFTSESPRWAASLPDTCELFPDGQLHLSNDQAEPCGLTTFERFDLKGSSVGLEVLEVGDCDLSLSFAVALPTLAAELRCVNVDGVPTLIAGLYGDEIDDTFVNVAFDPSAHHFWRIANPPGTDNIEMSAAGLDGRWQLLGTHPTGGAALDRATINVLAVDETPDGASGELLVDNLNLVPP